MGVIPLGRSEYARTALAPRSLVNMFFEAAPTNLEDQVALISRKRIRQFGQQIGAGPMRGIYRKGNVLANAAHSGKIIALSGTSLYLADQNGIAAPVLIDAAVEGDLIMSAEGNEDVVVLTCGTKLYSTDGNTLTQIVMPDDKLTTAVDYLNGYFLVPSELGRFYWSAIGGTSIDPLDYATAESQPDTLLTLKVIGDELWLFGRYSIEPWQPTGDLDLPFQRIGGRIFGIGVTGRETVQKLSLQGIDKVCWVGTDRRVYMTNPNPEPISDHGMEERLGRVTDPTEMYATMATDTGHDFYILHLPDGLGSFAFDLITGEWAEWASYGRDNFRGAVSTIGPNNQALLGDDTTGIIWELTDEERTDDTDPMISEFSGLLRLTSTPLRCNNVLLDLATGLTPDPDIDPMIEMAWSDDRGLTWEDAEREALGREGEYVDRVMWDSLGLMERPGRNFRWRTTEPVTVQTAKYNETFR